MPSHIEEQIYRDDINEQEEMSLDCWKVTFNFYQRLVHHGAPQWMVDKMTTANNHFSEAHKALKELLPYFPPRDGIPEPGE